MTHFPIVRSVLDADALLELVLTHYDIGHGIACHLLVRGVNDTYRVITSKGTYYLRVSTVVGYSKKQIAAEVELIQHLRREFITPLNILQRRDSTFVTAIQAPEGERVLIMTHNLISGDHTEDERRHFASTGKILAKMHLAADKMESAIARPNFNYQFFIEFPMRKIRAFQPFQEFKSDIEYLEETAKTIWEKADSLPKTAPIYGICHGDAMIGNTVLQPSGEIALLDFDYCGYGWRVYDIATLLWSEVFSGYNFYWDETEQLQHFLENYHDVRPITPEEYALIPTFIVLRQYFLFGAALKNASGIGIAWHTSGWFQNAIHFIRICLDGEWYEKSGLPRSL